MAWTGRAAVALTRWQALSCSRPIKVVALRNPINRPAGLSSSSSSFSTSRSSSSSSSTSSSSSSPSSPTSPASSSPSSPSSPASSSPSSPSSPASSSPSSPSSPASSSPSSPSSPASSSSSSASVLLDAHGDAADALRRRLAAAFAVRQGHADAVPSVRPPCAHRIAQEHWGACEGIRGHEGHTRPYRKQRGA